MELLKEIKTIRKEIDKNNNIAFKLQKVNTSKALEVLFKNEKLFLRLNQLYKLNGLVV